MELLGQQGETQRSTASKDSQKSANFPTRLTRAINRNPQFVEAAVRHQLPSVQSMSNTELASMGRPQSRATTLEDTDSLRARLAKLAHRVIFSRTPVSSGGKHRAK